MFFSFCWFGLLTPGTAFIRWGHDSCPETANLIYKGSMAGGRYDLKGTGSNHLCLPFDPQYVQDVANGHHSYIYGSEYESVNNINFGKDNIQDRNIPCAVCRIQMRSTSIMIPAHNSCPQGWTREYYGFLMASDWRLPRSSYICMDREMKPLPGHAGHQKANDLFSVATQCGFGLDCPPYQNEKPITCAMCSV